MTQPDPHQRLTAAIAALCDPTVVRVDRLATTDTDRDAVRAVNAEARSDHDERMAVLRKAHAEARERIVIAHRDAETNPERASSEGHAVIVGRNHAQMRRIMATIIERETAHRAAAERRRAGEAVVPSLLDQVLAAVESSSSTGGAPAVGASRSPLGLAAVELIGDIARETECPRGAQLDPHVRLWASNGGDSDTAADLLEMWATTARGIVEPARTAEARAACPVCNHRWTWVVEDGERVRKAVISINLSGGYASCLNPSCGTRWDRDHFPLLAAALLQDVDERRAKATP